MDKIKMTICLLLVALTTDNMIAQINYTFTFNRDSLQMSRTMCKDGNFYTVLKYKDYVECDEPGMPSLPCKYLQFLVPGNAGKYVIEMNWSESVDNGLPDMLYPAQPPVYTSDRYPRFVSPDRGIYTSFALYPSERVSIVQDGYYDGDKRVLTVKVVPFQYLGASNRLTSFTKLNFTIKPDKGTITTDRTASIRPAVVQDSQELTAQLSFVENRADISGILRQVTASVGSSPVLSSADKWEYLIVASAPYAASAERLAFWKKLKGVTSKVVTIESILSDPSITGDLVSGIYDSAGKLRHFLSSCYKNRGTKYVLLVGKDIPYRCATLGPEVVIPTDLYYCDLNGNWDVDKDKNYGEMPDDHVDYLPELYVGRLLCKNNLEFINYLHKLYCYEKNPGGGNSAYLKRAFFQEADENQMFRLAYGVSANMILNVGFTNILTLNEEPACNSLNPTSPTGKKIIDEINTGYGFVYMAAHGKSGDITVLSAGLADGNNGIDPTPWLDCIKAYKSLESNHVRQSPGNSVDCLTNFDAPHVVYTHSCTTMPFDKVQPEVIFNMGEAFTVAGKYGAVAYLGCTREIGIPDQDFMAISFSNFLKQVNNRVGVADANSKIGHYSHVRVLAHNLLGCPEFRMWDQRPTAFIDVRVEKALIIGPADQNNIQVSLSSPTKCQVNVMGLFGGKDYFVQQKTSFPNSSFTFNNVPPNCIVSLISENKLPYVAPLYLQNEEVEGKHLICHVNSVSIGSNVSNQITSGDFIVKSGADVSIQATDNVLLDCGFEVELGASFEIFNTN